MRALYRVRLLTGMLFGFAVAGCGAPEHNGSDSGSTAAPPNIVLILFDDMGYSDLGSYGGEIRTPAMDALAKQGLRLTQFYNGARCTPTRASLLTGYHPHQVGLGSSVTAIGQAERPEGAYQGYIDDAAPTIAETLKNAGYATYMSGKWHVGEQKPHWPTDRGFDRYFGLISGASSYFEIVEEPRARTMALDGEQWTPPEEGFYMTDAFVDHAIEFVSAHEADKDDQPFFLYLAFTAPHWPLHAPEDAVAAVDGRYDAGWDAWREERLDAQKAAGLVDADHPLSERPSGVPPWAGVSAEERTRADWARRMEVYAAMIEQADRGVARFVTALRQQGELDDTVILILSDNGASAEDAQAMRGLSRPGTRPGERGNYESAREPWAYLSNTPFRGYKRETYEGGIRTPFILHWPSGLKNPGRVDTSSVGHVVDIAPTVYELAGADPAIVSPAIEGRAFTGVFRGEVSRAHEILFWEHLGGRAVREGEWKAVYHHERRRWELYDLSADPIESVDLSVRHPNRLRAMADKWSAWAVQVGVREEDRR